MRQDEDRAIEAFRSQLGLVYLCKYGLAALTVWAFLYGSAVLALRGAMGLSVQDLAWGLCSLPVALAPAVWLAMRRLPSHAAVRAVLDRHSRCGGLLMAGAECSTEPWHDELPELNLPGVRWRWQRTWGLFAAGCAFVALAFLVPQSLASLTGSRMDVSPDVEKLAKQIETLEQEKVIDARRGGDLKEKLEQVRRDARGRDPVKTLQALDHVKDLTSKAAQEAAEGAAKKMEELARAETLASALEKSGSKMEPGQLAEAMNELAALRQRAATERELLESGLDPETLEALKNGSLSKEQFKKLLGALKNMKEAEMGKVGRLVQVRLLDASALEKCEKAGKCDCAALAAFLKENGAKDELADAIANSDEGGKGGVDEGPGSSKIKFDHETDESGLKFKEEELPLSSLEALKDSTLTGVSVGKPKPDKEKPIAGGSGALAGAKAGGGSANTQVVLPRHKGAVERYFDRPAAGTNKK